MKTIICPHCKQEISSIAKEPITFWQLLNKTKIVIPIIQRDYAQGRVGKEKLREKFLFDLKYALDCGRTLQLDFIYGAEQDSRFQPLDGQQRLTTLWLLHWYVAFRANKLEENQDCLLNFSYETRSSSRSFCKELCNAEGLDIKAGVVEQIKDKTWFSAEWKQDPTIQAMLNMLGGTAIRDKKNLEIIDGLEEIFLGENDFSSYWDKLTSEECPITFYFLNINDNNFAQTDDLYIKMNARGKALTSFENFKSDIVKFVEGYDNTKEVTDKISHNLDTNWTNIFWDSSKSECKSIDESYFVFLNRYFFNYLVLSKVKDIEENRLFKYLYGKGGENVYNYDGFKVYKEQTIVFNDSYAVFDELSKVLNNFHKIYKIWNDDLIKLDWNKDNKISFIPKYNRQTIVLNDKNVELVDSFSQSQRVVFFAVCKYFYKNEEYDHKSFSRWMRVVWNIVENSGIDSVSSMIGCMRLIDELSENCDNKPYGIYTFLASDTPISSGVAKEQVAEEREKAKKIIEDINWEKKINEAENYAFFKGQIRFLFRGEEQNSYNWDKFESRFEKCKLYFDKNGVKEEYKKGSILLKALVSVFNQPKHFHNLYYDNTATNWKNIFSKYHQSINKFFDIQNIEELDLLTYVSKIEHNNYRHLQEDLCKTGILSILKENKWYIRDECGALVLRPDYKARVWKKYILSNKRNEILSNLFDENIIYSSQKLPNVPFFWGWDIRFTKISTNEEFEWSWQLKKINKDGSQVIIADVILDTLEDYIRK